MRSLEFSPVTLAVLAIQPVENANPVTARDRPDRSNVADQLEFGFHVRRLQDRTPAAQRPQLSGFGQRQEREALVTSGGPTSAAVVELDGQATR